jgi:hypothetical protein
MSNEEETVITLIFENAANESKLWQVPAVSGELMRDYVGRAAKSLFNPVPQRVGIATKDGAIIQNWSDRTVGQVTQQYKTNHIVIGTPDQLGGVRSFFTRLFTITPKQQASAEEVLRSIFGLKDKDKK